MPCSGSSTQDTLLHNTITWSLILSSIQPIIKKTIIKLFILFKMKTWYAGDKIYSVASTALDIIRIYIN